MLLSGGEVQRIAIARALAAEAAAADPRRTDQPPGECGDPPPARQPGGPGSAAGVCPSSATTARCCATRTESTASRTACWRPPTLASEPPAARGAEGRDDGRRQDGSGAGRVLRRRPHERFRQAVANVGEIHQDFRDRRHRGAALVRGRPAGALSHRALWPTCGSTRSRRRTPRSACGTASSTRVPMLPPPCDREGFSDRGDLWGFNSQRIKTAFHYHDFSVNLFDHERRTGHLLGDTNAGRLPYWVAVVAAAHAAALVDGAATAASWSTRRRSGSATGALLVGRQGRRSASPRPRSPASRPGSSFMGDDYVIVRRGPTPTVF